MDLIGSGKFPAKKEFVIQALRIMKLTTILLTFAFLQVSATGKTQTITISATDVPLKKIFSEITKQTSFNFLYSDQDLEKAKKVSLSVTDASLRATLDICFKGQLLSYVINETDRIVIVQPRTALEATANEGEFELLIEVKGKIVNENGEPVAGASVRIKGTEKGTSTDENGEFKLTKVNENATLVISGANIETLEWKINGRTDLSIEARTKIVKGEEAIINTGYQKLRPNEVVGSIVNIDKELLSRTVSTDGLSPLEGVVPGLLFKSGSERYTTPVDNILIRSYSTIKSKQQPLIVIDDFPFEGDINSINPNDIENITVLKDAVAASIWGARAGNGVIVISTKTGKFNRGPRISVNSNITVQERPDVYYSSTLNSEGYIDIETFLFDKGFYNSSITSSARPPLTPALEILLKRRNGEISASDSANLLNELKTINLKNDLKRYYYRQPVRQQYAINLSNGGPDHSYYLSAGYDHNLDKIVTDNYSRFTVNIKSNHSFLNHHLDFNTEVWYTQEKTLSRGSNTLFSLRYPYEILADDKGNPWRVSVRRQGYIDTAGGGKLLDWNYYPLQSLYEGGEIADAFEYRVNTGIKFKVWRGLDMEIKYQYGKDQADSRQLNSERSYYTRDYINQFTIINWTSNTVTRPVPLGGILDLRNNTARYQNLRSQINYSRSWGSRHRLIGVAGFEARDRKTTGNSYRYYGYNEENGSIKSVDFANPYKNYITGSSSLIRNGQSISGGRIRFISAYANLNYTFRSRYSFYVSARRDGSNIFGANTNNKWKPLWSVGERWDIDKESFYHISWLPDLKLRASYGYQGNVGDPVGLLTITYGPLNLWNLNTAAINNPPNPDLSWENIGQFNVGVDFGLKKSVLRGTIEYYRKKGTDLIGDAALAPSSGWVSFRGNTADIKGEGVDVSLASVKNIGRIKWETSLLVSYARDWVTKYRSSATNIGDFVLSGSNPIIGKSIRAIYSYRWAGLDPATGDPLGYHNKEVTKDYSQILYSANFEDMVYSGPAVPPYFGSLLNSFQWKGFSFSFNIIYKLGNYLRRPSIDYSSLFSGFSKGSTDYFLRWQKPGDENYTSVPSLVYPANSNRDIFYGFSEVLIEKAGLIRLQDARFSYDITKLRSAKIPFRSARLYLYASNLGLLWKANKKGIDPDYPNREDYTNTKPGISFSAGITLDL